MRPNIGSVVLKAPGRGVGGKVFDLLLSISHFRKICSWILPASSAEGQSVLCFAHLCKGQRGRKKRSEGEGGDHTEEWTDGRVEELSEAGLFFH